MSKNDKEDKTKTSGNSTPEHNPAKDVNVPVLSTKIIRSADNDD